MNDSIINRLAHRLDSLLGTRIACMALDRLQLIGIEGVGGFRDGASSIRSPLRKFCEIFV